MLRQLDQSNAPLVVMTEYRFWFTVGDMCDIASYVSTC